MNIFARGSVMHLLPPQRRILPSSHHTMSPRVRSKHLIIINLLYIFILRLKALVIALLSTNRTSELRQIVCQTWNSGKKLCS